MATKKKDKLSMYRMDPSGKYVYTGAFVTWKKTDKEYRLNQAKKILFCAGFFGLQMLLGLPSNMGMDGNPFLLIPYTAAVVLSAIMIFNMLKTVRCGTSIKTYEYEETVLRFPKYVFAGMILCGICILGYVGYGLLKGWTNPLYLVFEIAACILCVFFRPSFEKDDANWNKNADK